MKCLYTIFRQGENYPIWVREQGVGRNKSSYLTQVMDLYDKAGGDYHTSYWPQVHGYFLTLNKTEKNGFNQKYALLMGISSLFGQHFNTVFSKCKNNTKKWLWTFFLKI